MCAVRSQPYLKDFSSSKGPGSGTIEVNPGGIMCPPFVVRYNTVSPYLGLKRAGHLQIPFLHPFQGAGRPVRRTLLRNIRSSNLQAVPASLQIWDIHSCASSWGA
jgi:hypothetical protein